MIDGYYAADYQVHSLRSHDGKASIDELCAKAMEIGLDEIGFSEHKDFDPNDPVVNYFDYEKYMEEIQQSRNKWGRELIIRAGVEIDYQRWFQDEIAKYLQSHSFDFALGSVHYVNREMIMSPAYNRSRDKWAAYSDYFQEVIYSVKSGLFDVLAHLEYSNRRGINAWGCYDPMDYKELLTILFMEMQRMDMPLEINTAGLHQGIGLTYPSNETVAFYTSLGGKLISIGSDAHQPEQLGFAYKHACDTAIALGLNQVCTWEGRKMRFHSLLPASKMSLI